MTNAASADQFIGRRAVDPYGSKIGSVGQVYLDDETGQPDWVTVNTGLFGTRENFVPLRGSRIDGEDLVLPFDKDVVKESPQIADSSHLDTDEEQSLYAYYERYLGVEGGPGSGNETSSTLDMDGRRTGSGGGYDPSRADTDDAMTRSEEHLRVDTKKVEVGRARLRKYVVTEQQYVQVPVSREEVRVEREPITEADRGDALAGAEITEEEHEVVLHEERPVVATEAVPVERVRLGTENVTDQQTVSGDVRKERVEIDDGTVPRGGGRADKKR